jgi:pescadillo
MGTPITWIAPYQFNQKLPFDIDYKVMSTFLEFYLALVKFVNHKLFVDLGFKHPLENDGLREDGLNLDVLKIRDMQKLARKKFDQGKLGQA